MKNYFDSVYIVNLPKRTDRKIEMLAQFEAIGVNIDGARVRFFPAIRPDGPAGFPTLGARGCFLSHLAVLTQARDNKASNVLIIEDDCNFVRDFSHRMELLHEVIPKSAWSFFYGGALNAIESSKLQNGLLDPAQGIMGSHFVAVNGAVLPSLVSYLEAMLERSPGDPLGGPMHLDGAYSTFRAAHPQCATYLAVPELAYQRSSATDIHKRNWYEAFFVVQWVLRHIRRIKNATDNLRR